MVAKPKPVVATKPVVAKAKPVVAKAKPVVAKAKPVVAKAKPVVAKPKPVVPKVKPVVAKPKIVVPPVNVKPVLPPVKPVVAHVQQTAAGVVNSASGGGIPSQVSSAVGAIHGTIPKKPVPTQVAQVVQATAAGADKIAAQANSLVAATAGPALPQVEQAADGATKALNAVTGGLDSTLDGAIGGSSNGGGPGEGLGATINAVLGGIAGGPAPGLAGVTGVLGSTLDDMTGGLGSALGGIAGGPASGLSGLTGGLGSTLDGHTGGLGPGLSGLTGGLGSTVNGLTGSVLPALPATLPALSATVPHLPILDEGGVLGSAPPSLDDLIPATAGGPPAFGLGTAPPALTDQTLAGRRYTELGVGTAAAALERTSRAAAHPGLLISPFAASVAPHADSPASGTQRAPGPGDPGHLPGVFSGAAQVAPNGLSLFGFAALLLVALMAAAPAISRRIQIPPASWRPVPFISLLERPG